jgi:3-methyl-2-oxobutanoate hydroxymethyltransferase
MSVISPATLREMKVQGKKIAVLTAYDSSFAALLDTCGVDAMIVGDSLGMVIQGHDSTLPVTMDDMLYHGANVKRGSKQACIIVDMPYQSYTSVEQAVENARRLVCDGGADMVKLEGGRECMDVIRAIRAEGIAVCGHLGLQPQSVKLYGGYKVQGRDPKSATRILEDAQLLDGEGVAALVLECIPRNLAATISSVVKMPVIGIGAGPECDGQVLVTYDMLGITQGKHPKFVHDFMAGKTTIEAAILAYIAAVREGRYPAAHHCYD